MLTREKSEDVDFLNSFAILFSVTALAEILGLRAEDYMGVVHLTEQLLSFLGGSQADINKGREALSAYEKLMAYLKQVITEKRSNPSNDIISGGVQLLDDGRITEPELMAIVANLLVDGHEPIAHTLSNGLHSLVQHPSELSRLQSQPDLVGIAVEEMLRINPFFQYSARRATEDLALSGVNIKQNQRVMFMLGAANRDPKVFCHPDRFQLRDENKHLSFGQGIHYCLGAALGRMTSTIALNQILSLKENLSLTTEGVTWRQSVGYRGLTELPIHWESK
jgi:cytochrome P450